MLLKLGFSNQCIEKIMMCVRSVNFNLVLFGRKVASFVPKRGLRQWDPLSPYLFTIVANILSNMVNLRANIGMVKCIKIYRRCPYLTYFIFIDDTLVLLNASWDSFDAMSKILKEYCHASRQKANLDKTISFL